MIHDVAIVGAGPGGSATAHYLARRGLDVLLVDRAEFPRDKTCGDGLTPRALRVLADMGILEDVRRHGCPIGGYQVVAPNGKATTARITGEPGALAVPRLTLDELIRQRALGSGARYRGSTTVSRIERQDGATTLRTDGGETLRARVAVVATGAATGLLTRSGLLRAQPRAMLAARAYFDDVDPGDWFQLRFDHAPMPGYGWLFPVGPRRANVGVGWLPRRQHGHQPVHEVFERFVQHQPALAGARQVGPMRGYPIRVDFLSAPTHAEGIVLVGEAAGLVNPLTGEGIDYALESAQLAADHVAAALVTGDVLFGGYHRALHEQFGAIFRFSAQVRDWYCRPPLLNVLVPLANSRPALRQLLADIVLGERQPAGYSPLESLGRLLLYMLRTRRGARA